MLSRLESLAAPALAAPFAYSEMVSGGIASPATQSFTVDVGVNSITGSFGGVYPDVPDFDDFNLILPARHAAPIAASTTALPGMGGAGPVAAGWNRYRSTRLSNR